MIIAKFELVHIPDLWKLFKLIIGEVNLLQILEP